MIALNVGNDKRLQTRKKTEHNPHRLQILDHSCRILVVGGSESSKTNTLLNLINH